MAGSSPPKQADGARLSYDEAKTVVRDDDPAVRAVIAARPDIRPELLYYLATDEASLVRREIARNAQTPAQADLILAADADEAVRLDLATKVARLTSHLNDPDRAEAERYVLQTLELLARDQALRVRQVLSDTLRALPNAPHSVIQRLARDQAEAVACPVLELSPLLSDAELMAIIAEGCASVRLCAISRRSGLGAEVSDAIVGQADGPAIAALLGNDSAQIREETLDGLVEQSRTRHDWQAPLVRRPCLSSDTLQKLAGFVARHLLDSLLAREEIDSATSDLVAGIVQQRLDADASGVAPEDNLKALFEQGALDEAAVLEDLQRGERHRVCLALGLLGDLPSPVVARILGAGSAKGVTALSWKAGLSMRFASQLQLRMGGIPPSQLLNARGGTDYPLTPEEMTWQLEFFGAHGS